MPIDAQIPLGVNAVPPTNPLALATQAAGLQGQINTNRAAQSTFAARNALGPIFQQGVNPDGTPDINKIFSLMSRDPRAAYLAPEITNQLIQRELTQKQITVQDLEAELKRTANVQSRLNLAQDQLGTINRNMGSLMQLGDTVTYDQVFDIASTLVGALNDPTFTSKTALMLADATKAAGPSGQGPGLAAWVKQQVAKGLSSKEQLDAQAGQIHLVQQGLRTAVVRTTGWDNYAKTIGTLQNYMTPAEASTPQEGEITPGGAKTNILRGAAAERGGQVPVGTYTGTGGIVPPEQVRAAIAAPTPAPGERPAWQPVTSYQTTLPPDQEAALAKLGGETGEYVSDLNKRVRGGQDILLRIAEMQDLLPKIRTGGGSEFRLSFAKLLQAMNAPNSATDFIAEGDVGSAETFKKYSVAGATEALRNLLIGSRMTNLEFEQFQKNNPNLDTDPRAIEKMLAFTTRVERLAREEQQEFAKYKGPIKDWPATWAKMADERGLVLKEVTQGLAKSHDRENRPDEASQYANADTVVAAHKAGKITRDDAARILRERKWAQ